MVGAPAAAIVAGTILPAGGQGYLPWAVGALLAGWLFSELGVDTSLVGVGVVALACAVILYLRGRAVGPSTLAAPGGADGN